MTGGTPHDSGNLAVLKIPIGRAISSPQRRPHKSGGSKTSKTTGFDAEIWAFSGFSIFIHSLI